MGHVNSRYVTTTGPEQRRDIQPGNSLHVHSPRAQGSQRTHIKVSIDLNTGLYKDYTSELTITSIDKGLVMAEVVLGAQHPRGVVIKVTYKRLLLMKRLSPRPGPPGNDGEIPLGFITLPVYIDPRTIDLDLDRRDGDFVLRLDAQMWPSFLSMLEPCSCKDCVRKIGETVQADPETEKYKEHFQPFDYEICI